jgi:glycosyltransferase involved in cell wall biosynthesis
LTHVGSVSVCLPCRNEAAHIPGLVARTAAVLGPLVDDFEIIVVDDGSTDGTPDLLRAMAAADPRIRTVRHAQSRGYGAALLSGFGAARCEYVFLTDGDAQFDVAEFPLLVDALDRGDLAVGRRIDRRDPWMRRANGAAWNFLVRRLFGLRVRDVDCAFKLIPTRIVQSLPLRASGAVISTELLVLATRAGSRIAEVGVRHLPRTAGRASGGDVRVVARAFRELFGLWWRLRAERASAVDVPAADTRPAGS